METVLDLHIHSKYSRACSKNLVLPIIGKACAVRGIDVVATGDFTHPAWLASIKEELKEAQDGIFVLKDGSIATQFILGTEISCIYKHNGAVRRVHHLLFAPSIEAVDRIVSALTALGANLRADGRPIIGLSSKSLLQLVLEADKRCVLIPAHAWTPWFAVFGSKSGYDSLEECFEELTPHVRAIETGLSSDPAMNARLSALDPITLISNSDAHSPDKLGREANVFDFESSSQITYDEIMRILREKDRKKFLYTIEFFPEEGKYHADGHRACRFWCYPQETKRLKGICPVCGRPLTVGVLHRVDALADRPEGSVSATTIPFRSIIPLREIIANVYDVGVASVRVKKTYDEMTTRIGNEFFILLHAPTDVIKKEAGEELAHAIARVREGRVHVRPGYDGEFGEVSVFKESEKPKKKQEILL